MQSINRLALAGTIIHNIAAIAAKCLPTETGTLVQVPHSNRSSGCNANIGITILVANLFELFVYLSIYSHSIYFSSSQHLDNAT